MIRLLLPGIYTRIHLLDSAHHLSAKYIRIYPDFQLEVVTTTNYSTSQNLTVDRKSQLVIEKGYSMLNKIKGLKVVS